MSIAGANRRKRSFCVRDRAAMGSSRSTGFVKYMIFAEESSFLLKAERF